MDSACPPHTGEAIAKYQEAAVQDLKPWEAISMEEQDLRVSDLCRISKANRDKIANPYEGSHDETPLCFILMPFGTKANADGSMINFDRVYQDLIAPEVVMPNSNPFVPTRR